MTWWKIPKSLIKHLCKHYLKSNHIIFNKTKLNTCLCEVPSEQTIQLNQRCYRSCMLFLYLTSIVASNQRRNQRNDHSTSLLLKFTSPRKSLLLLTVSSQPKVTIITYDIIDFILTIGFETKTFFDGTTISLLLMLLLIVNVLTSVHESFLQLNVSGEPKVT